MYCAKYRNTRPKVEWCPCSHEVIQQGRQIIKLSITCNEGKCGYWFCIWLYYSLNLTYENSIFQQFMYLKDKCTKTGMMDLRTVQISNLLYRRVTECKVNWRKWLPYNFGKQREVGGEISRKSLQEIGGTPWFGTASRTHRPTQASAWRERGSTSAHSVAPPSLRRSADSELRFPEGRASPGGKRWQWQEGRQSQWWRLFPLWSVRQHPRPGRRTRPRADRAAPGTGWGEPVPKAVGRGGM